MIMNVIRLMIAVSLFLALQIPASAQSLDFQTYRTRIEPIFLKLREANGPGGSCFMCHTQVKTRFRLEPVSPNISWTEEQSRRNYDAVMKLVTPGDPSKSRLLLHPLAPEAGGDAVHAGGKHWTSQNDPEWQTIAAWIKSGKPAAAAAPAPSLDFEAFKTRIQPIFLRKTEGLARCYVCHSQGTNFRLQPLAQGSTTWTEEQSRMNFAAIQRLVVPGDPLTSRLLMMPLASEAGGDPFHPGGKHWASQNDPAWQTLAAWVKGQR
jgi:hypothetical protein